MGTPAMFVGGFC